MLEKKQFYACTKNANDMENLFSLISNETYVFAEIKQNRCISDGDFKKNPSPERVKSSDEIALKVKEVI